MDLDDLRASQNVEDRRGSGGFGRPLMIGGGGFGAVAVVLAALFFGVDPSQLLDTGGGAPAGQNRLDNGARTDNAAYEFSRKIIGSAEDVWQPLLQTQGARFAPATFTVYDYATRTGCGTGESSAGP